MQNFTKCSKQTIFNMINIIKNKDLKLTKRNLVERTVLIPTMYNFVKYYHASLFITGFLYFKKEICKKY